MVLGGGVRSYKSCPGGNGLRYTAVLGGVACPVWSVIYISWGRYN